MYTNLEIEFKSGLTTEEYEKLIKKYDLENKTFIQTNYYFDTENLDLIKNQIILRIREKDYNIKLSSKTKTTEGALERHIILEKEKAFEMIKNGFDASIIGIEHNVKLVASLQTQRTKMPYKTGVIFLDKNTYYDTVDYEVEFEAKNRIDGTIDFNNFLDDNDLKQVKLESKSKRAYKKSLGV